MKAYQQNEINGTQLMAKAKKAKASGNSWQIWPRERENGINAAS
jgi:hypothetical protein